MKKSFLRNHGFTLVELIVVIAIIGILAGIVTVNLTSSRSKARDVQRISDVGQLQLALELFFDRCNRYPSVSGGAINMDSDTCVSHTQTISMRTFISTTPIPPYHPDAPQSNYGYAVNGAATSYVLMAVLENYNEALGDDVDGESIFNTSVDCDEDNNGEGSDERRYCVGPN